MAAPLVYNVLTEFRFEVGHAILGTERLAGAVDQVSTAADNALSTFQRLGFGIVASLGLGTTGFLGALGAALQTSDKFAQSQRDLANIITSNAGKTMSWGDALGIAAGTMENINRKAAQFSLSTTDLLSTSKQIGAVLLSHGLDDMSLTKSVEISRQYLKSAPTLGIDPGLAQQQLVRAVLGDASGNDTLFTRMTGETTAMKQFGGNGGTQKFNALPAAKRLEVLTRGLAQFSSNLNYVNGNARSLNGQMKRFGELLKGPFSILKDLGDTLMVPVLTVFQGVNSYLDTQGRQIIKSFSNILKGSLSSPERFLAGIMQAKSLKSDVQSAGTVLSVVGALSALNHIAGMLGFKIPLVTAVFERMAIFSQMFGLQASGFFGGLFTVLTRIFVPLALLIAGFQLLSKSIAYARIDDAKALLEIAPRFAKVMELFTWVFKPFIDAFDALAKFLSPIFQLSFYANLAVSALEMLAQGLVMARATFQGIAFFFFELFNQIKSFITGGGFNSSALGSAFNSGIDMALEEAMGKIDSGEAVVNSTTNIGAVNINNQFKENLEPDRVAFSLTKQLMKTAQNPTQSRDRKFAPVGATS